MVETQNLRKYYQLGTNTVKALDGVKRKNTDTAKWLDIFCVGRLCGTGTGAWKMQQNL